MSERSKGGMIVRARAVVTMDGPPIENGAVAISGGRIVDVGKFDQVETGNSGPVADLGECALLPGFINAHCHLDYTCLRGKIPGQKSFTDWIRAINLEKSKLGPEHYIASINEGFAEAKRFGTTTIVNLTAFPELICKILPSPVRTWWTAELIDVRAPNRATQFVESALESLTFAQNYGLAPHALFTASRNLYQRCNDAGSGVLLTTHLAESREEMEMFRNGSGPLYEFMENIGRPMDDCGRETPLERFVDIIGARARQQWLVAHLNELQETDFKLLEKMETRFHVAHSPRSHHYFEHSPFPFQRLDATGFNVCLGTDSLASNESLSLFAEMRLFRRREPGLSPEKILEMVTVNPAFALRQQNNLGQIRRGFLADLIAIPWHRSGDLFECILAFDGEIDWMMINGRTTKRFGGS